MNENFYIRIPVESIRSLKEISLIFMIQTLDNIHTVDKKKVIKIKRASESLNIMSKN